MDKAVMLEDLRRAVGQLDAALKLPVTHDVTKAGCIQYFEFSFELAWKTIKCIAEEHGVLDCISPKSALTHAFRSGWLDEEAVWLDMLAARNRMTHTYNAADALTVYDKLPEYQESLKRLTERLYNV